VKILMVNIGFVPDSLGGSEFYTYHLAQALQQGGHEVTVFAATPDLRIRRYKVTRKVVDGIRTLTVANSHLLARSFHEHFIDDRIDGLFATALAEERPDLVHFQHVAHLSGNLLGVARRLRVPSVFTLHDYWYLCFRSRLLRPGSGVCSGPQGGVHCATCGEASAPHPMAVSKFPLLVRLMHHPRWSHVVANTLGRIPHRHLARARALLFDGHEREADAPPRDAPSLDDHTFRFAYFKQQLGHATFLLSPSRYLKARYEAEGYRGIVVLPLGYPAPAPVERPPFEGALHVAFMGSIERHKGLTVLLREIADVRPGALRVNVYGHAKDAAYHAEARKLAGARLGGSVRFHGPYRSDRDLPRIFGENHLLVFPSIWEENAPLVVREALLHGVPVVGSALGGVAEILEDGVNGFLFDPFAPGHLRSILERVTATPGVLAQITAGARSTHVDTMAEHAAKLGALYARAVAERRPGAAA
jgi:glycosyltransferase involved in cell wall biosynthesis